MGGVSLFGGADIFGGLNKSPDTGGSSNLEASMKNKNEVCTCMCVCGGGKGGWVVSRWVWEVREYMWQSHVEIKGYSIAYFHHIAVFEALYH